MATYEQQEFLVPARDDKGHYEPRTVRFQPKMVDEMGKYVSGEKFPYREISDLIRHAVQLHLRRLATAEPFISDLGEMESINIIARQTTLHAEYSTTVLNAINSVDALLNEGEFFSAMEVYTQFMMHMQRMPTDNLRRKAEKAMIDKFGPPPSPADIEKMRVLATPEEQMKLLAALPMPQLQLLPGDGDGDSVQPPPTAELPELPPWEQLISEYEQEQIQEQAHGQAQGQGESYHE